MRIAGSNFLGTTSVTFGGVPATFFVVDTNEQVSVTIPPSPTAGTITVNVTNACGSGTANFTYQ